MFFLFSMLFRNWWKTSLTAKLKCSKLQSDGGREFENTQLGAHFLENRIYFQKSYLET